MYVYKCLNISLYLHWINMIFTLPNIHKNSPVGIYNIQYDIYIHRLSTKWYLWTNAWLTANQSIRNALWVSCVLIGCSCQKKVKLLIIVSMPQRSSIKFNTQEEKVVAIYC